MSKLTFDFKYSGRLWLVALFTCLAVLPAAAQRRGGGARGGGFRGGGGGGGFARSTARPSVTARPGGGFSGGSINRPPINAGAIQRPPVNRVDRSDINVNRPINVNDVDVNVNRDWDDDRWSGCCYHPVAAAVGVAAGAAITAAAIGSVVYSLPSPCVSTVVDGVTYEHCGSTWYQPQFSGSTTTYVVVGSPQ